MDCVRLSRFNVRPNQIENHHHFRLARPGGQCKTRITITHCSRRNLSEFRNLLLRPEDENILVHASDCLSKIESLYQKPVHNASILVEYCWFFSVHFPFNECACSLNPSRNQIKRRAKNGEFSLCVDFGEYRGNHS